MGPLPGPRRPTEVLRYAAAFATRPHQALLRLRRELGPVVAFGVGPTRVVGLFGAEVNEFVFTQRRALPLAGGIRVPRAPRRRDGIDRQRRR